MKAIFAVAIVTIVIAFVQTSGAITCPRFEEQYVTLLPNPENCSTFYICNAGIPYLMNCNEGLHFNAEEKVCDWPYRAKCRPNQQNSTLPSSPSEPAATNQTQITTTEENLTPTESWPTKPEEKPITSEPWEPTRNEDVTREPTTDDPWWWWNK